MTNKSHRKKVHLAKIALMEEIYFFLVFTRQNLLIKIAHTNIKRKEKGQVYIIPRSL